jgi:hypothetical protein
MISLFILANLIFLIYWMECERRAAARIRHSKEARKLFWKIMRAHARTPGISTPVMMETFDTLVMAGNLLYQ